ncbi:MAG: hypothetical protein V1889_01345 [archaeon]
MRIMKRGSGTFVRVLFVFFLFVLVNAGFIFYSNYDRISFEGGLTGFSVREVVVDTFEGLGVTQKIVLFAQMFIFATIVIFILVKGIGEMGIEREIGAQDVGAGHKKYETDLDVLNNLLKRKKKIHLSSIASTFKVSRETAMEWCRALEASHLGSIEYPAFGEPYIRI